MFLNLSYDLMHAKLDHDIKTKDSKSLNRGTFYTSRPKGRCWSSISGNALNFPRSYFKKAKSRSLLSRQCNRRAGCSYRKNLLIVVVYRAGYLFVYCIKLPRTRFWPRPATAMAAVVDFTTWNDPGILFLRSPASTFDIVTYIIVTFLSGSVRWHVGIYKARPRRRARQIYRLISGDTSSLGKGDASFIYTGLLTV